jgi:hypothetical protein
MSEESIKDRIENVSRANHELVFRDQLIMSIAISLKRIADCFEGLDTKKLANTNELANTNDRPWSVMHLPSVERGNCCCCRSI